MGKKAMKAVASSSSPKPVKKLAMKEKKKYQRLDAKALAKVGKHALTLQERVQMLMDQDPCIFYFCFNMLNMCCSFICI
jgi:hypothetical protein